MIKNYIWILFLLCLSANATMEHDEKIIYYQLSANQKFKAALVYDKYKEWYAFTVYSLKSKNEELMRIARINQKFKHSIKFRLTNDSNYLLLAPESTNKYEVYDLNTRRTIKCYGELDFRKSEDILISECYKNKISL